MPEPGGILYPERLLRRLGIAEDLLLLLWERKWWWLTPPLLLPFALAALIVFS